MTIRDHRSSVCGPDEETREANGGPEVVLDLSRLLSRLLHPTPTGVDRVEMAYARHLSRTIPDRLSFSAVHPIGTRYGRLSARAVQDFLAETEAMWNGALDCPIGRRARWARAACWLMRLWPRPIPRKTRARVLLQVSPSHLHHEELKAAILKREQAKFVCLIHDLIPIEYPEYARPGGADLHRRRMMTVARHADWIIANSAATRDSFRARTEAAKRDVPISVAHLGLDLCMAPGGPEIGKPYFVCVGTIEPRKNHLLLLHIWRRFVEERGPANTPRLVLIGRRGWENEQVVDMLERCPGFDRVVIELNGLSDGAVHRIIQGAQALLLPSFAEGYGMPVPEALALGVPVICSDLPALREAGGGVPDYLDPLDGSGWTAAIDDHAGNGLLRREQMKRLSFWRSCTWDEHLQLARQAVDAVGENRSGTTMAFTWTTGSPS